MQEDIVLIGSGGHCKTIVDSIERLGTFKIAGYIDLGEIGKEVYRGYKIIGHDEDMQSIFDSGIHNAFIAVGFMGKSNIRNRLYSKTKAAGFNLPVIIDPSAIVAKDAMIGEGTYIGRKAVVNADAWIGKNCIINTSAIVEHECIVGDYSHLAVAAVICGQTQVGEECFLGANSTVIQGLKLSDRCVVGAGSVVMSYIDSDCTAVGVPAKVIGDSVK